MADLITAPPSSRAADRERADRIYFTLAALLGAVVIVYFAFVPFAGGNLAFHFYLMLWITMASGFNVSSGFSGYMPFGYVAFYGVGGDTPQEVTGALVSCNYFEVLRRASALGPGFGSDCDAESTAPSIALGHELWATAFGADPDIIGRAVLLNRQAFVIVGVGG